MRYKINSIQIFNPLKITRQKPFNIKNTIKNFSLYKFIEDITFVIF